jgi:Kef-type K+ transport system membrane component KefB
VGPLTVTTVGTLVLIGLAAVLSPILSELTGKLAVPDVVIEIVLGIIIGPAVLAIAHPDSVVTAFSDMGLSYLMFLAGFELNLARIRGRSLRLAAMGWAMSLGIALLVAGVLVTIGTVLDAVVVGLALTTTALGTLLPILRDAGLLEGAFGSRMMAIGSVGEFGPIVGVAILLDHRDPGLTTLLLVLFVVVAVATTLAAARPHPPKVIRLLHRHLQSSAQLPIRVAVLFIFGLVYLAFRLGLDVLLGAFAAGIVVRLFVRGEDSGIVKGKLEAIGFGFLVPIFFIVSGMNFHLAALTSSPSALVRVPVFLVLFLVARGTPALLLYRRDLPPPAARAPGLILGHRPASGGGDHHYRGGGRSHAAGKRGCPCRSRYVVGAALPDGGATFDGSDGGRAATGNRDHWLHFGKRAPRRRVGRIARKEFGAVLSRHSGRL